MEHYQFPEDSLAYEEVLNWRGFAFETSHTASWVAQRKLFAERLDTGELDDGQYGIWESDRILNRVQPQHI
jgi:hypothetical protein